jgi:hypothetical protein
MPALLKRIFGIFSLNSNLFESKKVAPGGGLKSRAARLLTGC